MIVVFRRHVQFEDEHDNHEGELEHGQLFPQHVVDQVSILGSSTFLFDEQQAWLIDSGASSHLVGEGMLSSGHVEILEEHAVSVQCSLASGEPITLRRKVDLKVLFVTVEGSLVEVFRGSGAWLQLRFRGQCLLGCWSREA